MTEINREELAWAAGFVDGEGYFWTRHRQTKKDRIKYATIGLNVHQVDKYALERLNKALLGLGKVCGPYGPYSGNRQAHYQYVVGNFADTEAVIALLWNWLGPVKRKQAANALKLATARLCK